jgi:hypothetical protein
MRSSALIVLAAGATVALAVLALLHRHVEPPPTSDPRAALPEEGPLAAAGGGSAEAITAPHGAVRAAVIEPATGNADLAAALRADPRFAAALVTMVGRVVDEGGQGVPGLTVRIRRRSPEISYHARAEVAPALATLDVVHGVTAGDGRFAIGGMWPAKVCHEYELTDGVGVALGKSTPHLDTRAGAAADFGDLVWARAASIRGRAVTADGAPLAQAIVRVVSPGADDPTGRAQPEASDPERIRMVFPDAVSVLPASLPGWALGRERVRDVRTGRDGSFVVEALSPGVHGLFVRREGCYPCIRWVGSLVGGEVRELGELREIAVARFAGVVVDHTGQRVAGAHLVAAPAVPAETESTSPSWCIAQPVAASDGDGRFEFTAPSGATRIAARRDGTDAWTVLEVPQPSASLRVELPPVAAVDLEVVDGSGMPVDDARLALGPGDGTVAARFGLATGTPPPDLVLDVRSRVERSGPGRFRLRALPVGRYWIAAWSKDGATRAMLDVPAMPAVRLTLDPERMVGVIAVDARDAPVSNARITTRPAGDGFEGPWHVAGITDARGRARIAAISGERALNIAVGHPAWPTVERKVDLPAGEQRFVLGADGSLELRVQRDGRPLTDAQWKFALIPETNAGSEPGRARPASPTPAGTLVADPLGAGQWRIVVTRGGDGSLWTVSEPSPFWRVLPERISVVPGVRTEGLLDVVPDPAHDPHGITAVEGTATWNGEPAGGVARAPTGPRHLHVHDAGHPLGKPVAVTLSAGETARKDVALEGGALEGLVRGSDGLPAKAQVQVVGRPPFATDAAGRFVIERLVAGRYRLSAGTMAGSAESQRALAQEIEVVAGARSVVELQLVSCYSVAGKLPAELLGIPTPLCHLEALGREASRYGHAIPKPDGRFVIAGVTPGEYRLVVSRSTVERYAHRGVIRIVDRPVEIESLDLVIVR